MIPCNEDEDGRLGEGTRAICQDKDNTSGEAWYLM